jgi:hypothetical protein
MSSRFGRMGRGIYWRMGRRVRRFITQGCCWRSPVRPTFISAPCSNGTDRFLLLLSSLPGDIRALDIVVRIADNILALQNQNTPHPSVIWTGEADPVRLCDIFPYLLFLLSTACCHDLLSLLHL